MLSTEQRWTLELRVVLEADEGRGFVLEVIDHDQMRCLFRQFFSPDLVHDRVMEVLNNQLRRYTNGLQSHLQERRRKERESAHNT